MSWHSGRLASHGWIGQRRDAAKNGPIHIGAQVFAADCAAGDKLNLWAALGWDLTVAASPCRDERSGAAKSTR